MVSAVGGPKWRHLTTYVNGDETRFITFSLFQNVYISKFLLFYLLYFRNNRRSGVMVKAFALPGVDAGSVPVSSRTSSFDGIQASCVTPTAEGLCLNNRPQGG